MADVYYFCAMDFSLVKKYLNKEQLLMVFRNKYILTSVLFFFWLMFFDQNDMLGRFRYMRECRKLENEKVYYEERIKEVQMRLLELKTGNKNLEKFAREQYLMKKDNEEVFIIKEED